MGVADVLDLRGVSVLRGGATLLDTVDWAVEEGERWVALRRAIERNLTDVRVFRVGERRVDVYVVGRTRGGEWVGLHTTSVET